MNTQTKTCQNCKAEFTIEPEDFDFYKKIDVPAPTWCPECRLIRRLAWNNTRVFHKRELADTKQLAISIYSPDKPYNVVSDAKWWSDEWDPLEYGKDYDFAKPFFEQFAALLREVPVPHLQRQHTTVINSDYCNAVATIKNCYLVTNADGIEDSSYGQMIQRVKDSADLIYSYDCELCYEGVNLENCYRAAFSKDCDNCRNVVLCDNCSDCSDCIGCTNLKNKSFYIFNEPYTKEAYAEKVKALALDTHSGLAAARHEAEARSLKYPRRYVHGAMNRDVSGEYVYESRNVKNAYDVRRGENLQYCHFLKYFPSGSSDCYDYSTFGNGAELIYESTWCGLSVSNLRFCFWNYGSQDMQYAVGCHNSKDLFGCVGVRKKQYCILNKEYSKEEYETLVPKIIAHMNEMPYIDRGGREYKYGEFFPTDMVPFAYNETWAQDYFPCSQEQAIASGFSWMKEGSRGYQVTKQSEDIPDAISEVSDDVLHDVVRCAHKGTCEDGCATAFRVIPQELQLLRRLKLPAPRLCPNCRYKDKLRKRAPMRLWSRQCQCAGKKSENGAYENISDSHQSHASGEHCPNEFETSYSPNRPEIVYCESCYQAEVA